MSKSVKFDVNVKGLEPVVITDTMSNVKKVNKGIAKWYDTLTEVEKKHKDQTMMTDYEEALGNTLVDNLSDLLNLSADQKKLLSTQASRSDLEDTFIDLAKKFTGIPVPTVRQMVQDNIQALNSGDATEAEDPKSQDEE